MGLFSRVELPELLAPSELPCVSIYLSACIHRKSGSAQKQFQQAIHLVQQQLNQAGDRANDPDFAARVATDFRDTMQTLEQQVINTLTAESVVIFYKPRFLRCYQLPGCFIETVRVGQCFDLKPLMPLLTQGELFYVLAFGQSRVRLLQGSRQGIRIVSSEELPEPLVDAIELHRFEPSIRAAQSKRLIGSRAVGRPLIYDDFRDDFLEQEAFLKQQMHDDCQELAEQLDRFLEPQNAPLLLAGMPQLLSTYRTINTAPTMLNTQIAGNLDTMKLEELHQQAWNRVQELVSSEREQALRQYRQAAQVGSASNHLGEIITRAVDRRVKTLFIASNYQKWGRFNPYTWEVDVHWRAEAGDIDLTQLAIEQTLLYGGTVYVLHPEMFSSSHSASPSTQSDFGTIAAIFRS